MSAPAWICHPRAPPHNILIPGTPGCPFSCSQLPRAIFACSCDPSESAAASTCPRHHNAMGYAGPVPDGSEVDPCGSDLVTSGRTRAVYLPRDPRFVPPRAATCMMRVRLAPLRRGRHLAGSSRSYSSRMLPLSFIIVKQLTQTEHGDL